MRLGAFITDGAAVMLRQVHPRFFVEGRPSSQVFRPEARDEGLLSVHQEAMISAETAYANHVRAGFGSCGVVGILVSECASEGVGLKVLEAPLSTTDKPPDHADDPAHAAIDFRNLGATTSEKRGRRLANMSWARGFRFQPPAV
jgi:hypothetical protein